MSDRILIATGALTWNADERRTDRYGSVRLNTPEDNPVLVDPKHLALEGRHGKLIAKVVTPVDSPHIGDLFRGLRPSTPTAGEEVVFGEGLFFVDRKGEAPPEPADHEREDKQLVEAVEAGLKAAGVVVVATPDTLEEPPYDLIGLKPLDGRKADWLDPKAFYRTHLSVVELYFEPTPEPARPA